MATLNVEPHHIIQGCRERAGACETIPGDPAQLSGRSCSGPRRLTVLILRPSHRAAILTRESSDTEGGLIENFNRQI